MVATTEPAEQISEEPPSERTKAIQTMGNHLQNLTFEIQQIKQIMEDRQSLDKKFNDALKRAFTTFAAAMGWGKKEHKQ